MTAAATVAAARLGGRVRLLASAAVITRRNLRRLTRVPTLLALATVQPVLFVLLFTYAFGGAIRVPGAVRYVDYLLPGSSSSRSYSAPPRPGSPSPRTWQPA